MYHTLKLTYLAVLATQIGVSLAHPSIENAEKRQLVPLSMGLASSYGAIAHMTLTSTGNTLITGNCGTCPGTAITGFPPGVCTGSTSAGGTAACLAEAACLSAYNNARAAGPTVALPSADLVGSTLPPGVYTFPTASGTLSGTLTLDGALNPSGQFIFLMSTTFNAAAASKITLINGAQACNVYIIVGSSATVGAGSQLQANILAYTSVSLMAGASNNGTLCALNGAVTLINDAITARANCSSL
ncbi:hypothetical protein LOCC1_G008838 [Lachnellula occidentalis]|uniref:Ice-binding protein n=1 Tax=Lachnellula occidentalis TaxID=215460 RepID=A0A8H8UCF1_9HELO|nr:hypothetical protein LOCC1_G008838 [Lachnellula occidentalis]